MKNTYIGAGLVCVALGLFSVVGAAQADDTLKVTTPGAPAAAPTAVATATPDPLDKVVCRMQPPPLGTRIGREAICQTQREWDTAEKNTQSRFHEIQLKNNQINPGSGHD